MGPFQGKVAAAGARPEGLQTEAQRSRSKAKAGVGFYGGLRAPSPPAGVINDFSLFWKLEKASTKQEVSTLNLYFGYL